jgi:hypothetical protein
MLSLGVGVLRDRATGDPTGQQDLKIPVIDLIKPNILIPLRLPHFLG